MNNTEFQKTVATQASHNTWLIINNYWEVLINSDYSKFYFGGKLTIFVVMTVDNICR